MNNKITLSLNDWADMFSEISRDNQAIFWVTRINHKTERYEQLYLNNAYDCLTGHPGQLLFDYPGIFDSYIISDNRDALVSTWVKRHYNHDTKNNVSIYCLKKQNGNILWLRDAFYTIYNQHEQPLFGAGIAIDITENIKNLNQGIDKNYQKLQTDVFTDHANILNDKLKLSLRVNAEEITNKATINLSRREQQCAYYLAEGISTKKIASLLTLSPRTVEVYISRLKARFGSKNKAHLVSHLIKNGLV